MNLNLFLCLTSVLITITKCSYFFNFAGEKEDKVCSQKEVDALKKRLETLENASSLADNIMERVEALDNTSSIVGSVVGRVKTVENDLSSGPDSIMERVKALDNALSEVSSVAQRVQTLENSVPESGVNYIRFGHDQCSNDTQLVYSGYIVGPHFQHGGGANFLCLPKGRLEWPEGAKADFQSKSYIYGTEFEWQGTIDSLKSKNEGDVLCALCDAAGQSQQVMIPGKRSCPPKWRLEYSGVMMSSYTTHSTSSYICVDTALKIIGKSTANVNGALLYAVEVKCGPLPCADIKDDGKELACVVCTK